MRPKAKRKVYYNQKCYFCKMLKRKIYNKWSGHLICQDCYELKNPLYNQELKNDWCLEVIFNSETGEVRGKNEVRLEKFTSNLPEVLIKKEKKNV